MKRLFWLIGLILLTGCTPKPSTPQSPEDMTTTLTSKDQSTSSVTYSDVFVGDINFVAQLDAIHEELDDYVGKTIHMEGIVSTVASSEETDGPQYAVTRYYDLSHEEHVHTISVGLNCTYEGTWPEEGTWVEIVGTIETIDVDSEAYPIVRVTSLIPKETSGLEKVSS